MRYPTNISDIVRWRLCLGCGACAYICPQRIIELHDFLSEGIRPIVVDGDCSECTTCLDVCPAYETDHTEIKSNPNNLPGLKDSCGPVLEIWEGHARDVAIRFSGSSGGLITALSLYCLEKESMHGVLHIAADPAKPLRNQTTLSRTRQELLSRTGSRYAPASACDRLDLIECAPGPCVFVGQPSEVTALRKAEKLKPELKKNVGLAISFFCAGSPSTQGTLELLKSMGVQPEQVDSLRYRGKGWPGNFAVTLKGESSPRYQMSYKESWGFVQAYRPFSVHLWPDGTGEGADISCGDPWYRQIEEGELGSSLVVVRTERGRQIIRDAMRAGYVSLRPAEPEKLIASQKNLLAKRGAIWGRVMALKAFGLPTPRLNGFSLFKSWLRLPFNEKLRSTLGTIRRIITRKYYHPMRISVPLEAKSESAEYSQQLIS